MKFIFLVITLIFVPFSSFAEDKQNQEQAADPVHSALAGMSYIEQYCSGVATLDYGLANLMGEGLNKVDAATKIVEQLVDRFPDEDPNGLIYMVAILAQDVFTHRSLHIETLVAYHFFSCIEGMATGNGMVFGDKRLADNVFKAVSCEAPGENLYTCLTDIFGFEIPKEIKEGTMK